MRTTIDQFPKPQLVWLAVSCALVFVHAAQANDWGYDDPQMEELKAQPGSLQLPGTHSKVKPKADKPQQEPTPEDGPASGDSVPDATEPDSQPAPPNETYTPHNDNSLSQPAPAAHHPNKVVGEWLSLLGLIAPIPEHGKLPSGPDYSTQLSEAQQKRFGATLTKLLSGSEQAAFKSISGFWPALSKVMHKSEDHRADYRVLFRALLTKRAEAKDIGEDERMMLLEALGPKRIAEIGPPPLTEDAINAYTDMACFLYEQSHPGKTVDADDNREIFAMVVRDKFKNAPSDKDREAMNDFALSWAKFRILYTDGNESEKALLATRIASEQGTKGLNLRNTMLETVLASPVWKRFVINVNKTVSDTNLKKSTRHGTIGGGSAPVAAAKTGTPAKKSRDNPDSSIVEQERPL